MKAKRYELIAYCGLNCGNCSKYKKGKCSGCEKNEKASWCKIRKCCKENGLESCADCQKYASAMDCRMYNNFMSKLFSVIFRSDRNACLRMIKEEGYEKYADYMGENNLVCIKRK